MKQKKYTIALTSKKMLAQGVWELVFTKPDDYPFQAGQFCQFFISKDGGEIIRVYSIGSAPNEDFLKFYVKLIPGGQASQYFGGLQISDHTKIGSAMGMFIVPDSYEGLTMIATGVGVAPIFGFIKDQLDFKGSSKKLKLLFGVRSEDDLFLVDELEEYRQKYDNFSYVMTLSQPKSEADWRGAKGRVTNHLLSELDSSHHFFICGSPAMVMEVKKLLIENKIDNKKIHLEAF